MTQAVFLSYEMPTTYLAGEVTLEGGVFHVTHKKPRSSKMLVNQVPAAAVRAAVVGEAGWIVFDTVSQEEIGSVTGLALDSETGLYTGTTEDDNTVYVRGAAAVAQADQEDEPAPKAKAKAPVKGGKKAAADDEDDGDDEPAPKKAKGKVLTKKR